MFLACDPPEEDDGSSSGGVTRINITDAQSLVVVPASSLNSDSSLAAGSALGTEQKVLAKIKEDGTAVVVPIENPDGQLKSSSVPEQIIQINDDYLMLEFKESAASYYYYLVRKNDGAMFDLAISDQQYHISREIEGPHFYTDSDGNIYYIEYSNKSAVKKIDVSNSAAPTKQDWTTPNYNLEPEKDRFVVDAKGNMVFTTDSYNKTVIKIATNKRIQEKLSQRFMYLGLDGKIYYGQYDSLSKNYSQKSLSQQPGDDGYLASEKYGPSFSFNSDIIISQTKVLVYLEDRILLLPSSHRNLDSWVELYKQPGNPTGIKTIAALSGKKLKGFDSNFFSNPVQVGKNNFYVLTEKNGIYRVDGNNYTATQIFNSSQYDVYKMVVSTDARGNDSLTFNAVDKNNSDIVTGKVKIDANGTKGAVELIEELDGVKLTILQRIN